MYVCSLTSPLSTAYLGPCAPAAADDDDDDDGRGYDDVDDDGVGSCPGR